MRTELRTRAISKARIDPPESTHLSHDRLDAGLAAAFGSDSALFSGTTGSVHAAASRRSGLPRVRLRDSEEEAPTVKSHEIPPGLESSERYELLGEIGRGGMGTIYWARDRLLGRELAIKVLAEKHQGKPLARERFVEESQIAGQMQHPGIVPVHELGEFEDGRPYLTMKLIKGQTLAELLAAREDPARDRPRLLGIFAQICQTLAYAHSRGVIHRDLKPANIMVGAFGEVQVMDWGLAKVLSQVDAELESEIEFDRPTNSEIPDSEGADADTVGEPDPADRTRMNTHDGTILGTPAYISPEQARGEVRCTDQRSDVFGLGAILCGILTGSPPYDGENVGEVEQKARNADLTDAFRRLDACGADDELILLTKSCLDLVPDNRPQHAGELADEFTAYLRSVDDRLRQSELENAGVRARAIHERKLRWMTVTLAALVLLCGAGAVASWFWVQHDRQNQITATNKRLRAELKKEKESTAQGVLNFYTDPEMPTEQILPHMEQMVAGSFSDSPFVEAMFREMMSSSYLSLKHHDLALENAEKAVQLLTAHAGPESPATLAAQAHLRRVQDSLYARPANPVPRDKAPPNDASNGDESVVFGSSYEQAVLADRPAGYWQLNEAAGAEFARDASENGNPMRYHGTSATEAGATTFHGTTDFVQGPNFKFPKSAISIEFWLKSTASNDTTVISYANYRSVCNEVAINHEFANGLWVHVAGQGEHTGVHVNDGRWHHVVVTWQALDGALQVYKDGSLAFRGYHWRKAPIFGKGSLVFGQDQDEPGGFNAEKSYPGLLAEVAIYDKVLPGDRVAAHYTAAKSVRGERLKIAASDDDRDAPTTKIIQTIVAGDGTQHSDYPGIGRPSDRDYADPSRGMVMLKAHGPLHPSSGPTGALRDGVGQAYGMFFADRLSYGFLLMDLGREVAITKVNTYTWGRADSSEGWRRNARAAQRYTLYATSALSWPSTAGAFWTNEQWKMITHVDTDAHFAVPSNGSWSHRPEQQAVSITSRNGTITTARYLLWKIYRVEEWYPALGEIDVYVEPFLESESPDGIIQKIVIGDGTRDSHYQEIGQPSDQDYADKSRGLVTLKAIGELYESSGSIDVLRDGHCQSYHDSSKESLFFGDHVQNGCLLMDLGREVQVTKINTYTWHGFSDGFDPQGRAAQQYVLYGSNSATPPTEGDFWTRDEWAEITRVDTDAHFYVSADGSTRPAQQAVSITSRDGVIANVRYLLWRLTPSRRQQFLGEIDVYVREDAENSVGR